MAMINLWGEDPDSVFGDSLCSPLRDDGESQAVMGRAGWNVEQSIAGVRMPAVVKLGIDEDEDEEYYGKKIRSQEHTHYVSQDLETPMIISIAKKSDTGNDLLRAATRLPKGLKRSMITQDCKEKEKLKRAGAPEDVKFKMVKSDMFETVSEQLHKMEKRDLKFRTHHTVGILYRKEGQMIDNEMYCNQGPAPDFDEFLDFIGTESLSKAGKGLGGD
eukprot:CAMPEP_0201516320 /NCGR_PEP_ID=MMETSP0161_2-20130828/7677_1 /ASSEMBLY_ACC=CAM_ASM_000251 /TAXON_ID=180227 /ORGANISM="Neoparamoeba aestuarina, Strain SoJaBio B1-5/56/2" /LENGTH=216 /DNA_ID=CAMNT_0047913405 /DNA_START=215 /DNA_END=866 /DNA_ORIENTATION=-